MNRPYTEQVEDGFLIREFSENTPSMEFVWHRDRNDRVIEPVHETDWKFQLDNECNYQFQSANSDS